MRIMAVDPGDKRIGLAISDLSATIANPFRVLVHRQREKDAESIALFASENDVVLIIVGQALDSEGAATPSSRKAERLAAAIEHFTDVPVKFWDESGSTVAARQARIEMGVTRKKRSGHMDDLAATVILQSFLDSFDFRQIRESYMKGKD
ncbi:MAG: hypothetical protein BGO78_16405 [Chloroflexi bacterium 44-23]|nr:MAG: hypothetical protein BGO78_16405 [Chloroflexi bacterium 44-23]